MVSGKPAEEEPIVLQGGNFDVGSINVVQSAPDHEPPMKEDTIEGRYAAVLFTSASQQGALFDVYEDIMYL